MEFDLRFTLILMLVFGLIALGAGIQGARPPSLKGPRMIPWRFIMLVCVTICVILIVHVLALFGVKTGRDPY
jgi:hypothetical protein